MFSSTAHLYDAIYSFKDYRAETDLVRAILERYQVRPTRTLLDVGCGTGGHLAALSEEYQVEGLDLDPDLLAVARERLPGVPLHAGDMSDFDLGHTFDAVISLFSAIGYVRTREAMRSTFERMAAHLDPSGLLLVEPWFPPGVIQEGRCSLLNATSADGYPIARLSTISVEGSLSILEFQYLVGGAEGIRHFVETHTMGLFTHEEQVEAMERAGVELLDVVEEGFAGRGLLVGRKH